MDMIRSGRADVVVAGGTEAAIHGLNVAAFAAARAMSTRNDDPQRASRPWDRDRDGFVLGEGAGIVVLESEEYAKARGARIYAYAARRRLLRRRPPHRPARARGPRHQHGDDAARSPTPGSPAGTSSTSTRTPPRRPPGDVIEVQARGQGHRRRTRWSTSTKSMTGHLLGGAGGIESVFTDQGAPGAHRPRHHQPRRPRRRHRSGPRPRREPHAARRRHRRGQQLVRLRRPQRDRRVQGRLRSALGDRTGPPTTRCGSAAASTPRPPRKPLASSVCVTPSECRWLSLWTYRVICRGVGQERRSGGGAGRAGAAARRGAREAGRRARPCAGSGRDRRGHRAGGDPRRDRPGPRPGHPRQRRAREHPAVTQ